MATQRVTDEDLGRFATVGFDSSVDGASYTDSDALFESLCRAVEHRSARLMKAVCLALVELAEREELSGRSSEGLTDEARRVLGYLSERAAGSDRVSSTVSRALSAFADHLNRPGDRDEAPLALTAVTTDSYLRVLRQRADGVSLRWGVFGDVTEPA